MTHEHVKTRKFLVKTAGLIGVATLCCRISGLVRDMVCANLFGLSRVWDAFVYAFMIPNLLRRLVGEGALSSAFIPVYAQVLKEKGKDEADRVASIVFSMLVAALGIFLFCVHWILTFIVATFSLSVKVALVLKLLMILFPYIFFLANVALFMGVAQCHKKFFVSAITPLVLNVLWILTALIFCQSFGVTAEDKIHILAWGVLFAGLMQFLLNYVEVRNLAFRPRFIFDFKHPVLRQIFNLMLPAMLGFSITQINIFVDLNLAMFLGDGANSALWYGNRLMQFPLGIFGIAMGTALLPTISEQAAARNMPEFKSTLSFSLRTVFLLVIPASVGLIVLREPIIQLLFERGQFDASATSRTALTLCFYCLGLFAYAGLKLIVTAFYSLQDTKTPVKIGALCMVINIGCNLIFMQFLREAGLALATALSSALNYFLLIHLLRKKIGSFEEARIIFSFVRITLVSLVMGLAVHYFYRLYAFDFTTHIHLNQMLRLCASILVGASIFATLGFIARIPEFSSAVRLFQKKRS